MQDWPSDYSARLTGEACALCHEGRPSETPSRLRFYTSELCDGYLQKRGVQRGYTTLVWRPYHAVEPTDLSDAEATALWLEVLKVGRALQTHYAPLKMNYQLLGHGEPHLHWLLAPRFVADVAPGQPLPSSGYTTFPRDDLERDARALQRLLAATP